MVRLCPFLVVPSTMPSPGTTLRERDTVRFQV